MTTTTAGTTVGTALRTLRKASGLTIQQVATIAGVSAAHLNNAENGRVMPKPLWIAGVAEALGTHIKDAA